MTDTEKLTWIANHLQSFRPAISTAYMTYIDEDGMEQEVSITGFNLSLEVQLDFCIEQAIKDETSRKHCSDHSGGPKFGIIPEAEQQF